MPGCAAIGCNNRSEKGYTMKCFPRDPVLRQIWKERVGRADWEPSNNSFLCHVHFESNQWIVTPSGRVKLRKGALPSIFTVTSTRKSCKKRVRMGSLTYQDDDFEEYEVEYLENEDEMPSFLSSMVTSDDKLHNQRVEEFKTAMDFHKVERTFDGTKLHNYKFENNKYKMLTDSSLQEFQSDSIITVSDESHENVTNENNYIMFTHDNKLLHQNNAYSNNTVKVEVKRELEDHMSTDEEYVEIEKRLKLICDGENYDNIVINKNNSTVDKKANDGSGKCVLQNISMNEFETNSTVHRTNSICNPCETKHNNVHKMTDNELQSNLKYKVLLHRKGQEEDEDEKGKVKRSTKNEEEEKNENENDEDENGDEVEKEVKSEVQEKKVENYLKDREYKNMMYRKRTREMALKSIESSLTRNMNNIHTLVKSDTKINEDDRYNHDSIVNKNKYCNFFDNKENTGAERNSKFTIKVSGVPEDVCEIVKDFRLSSPKESIKYAQLNQWNNGTFIITVEDLSKLKNCDDYQFNIKKGSENGAIYDISKTHIYGNDDKLPFEIERDINKKKDLFKLNCSTPYMQRIEDSNCTSYDESKAKSDYVYNEWRRQLESHERHHSYNEMINYKSNDKLTNQITVYKDFERTLKSMVIELKKKHKEVEVLKQKLYKKTFHNKKGFYAQLSDDAFTDVNDSLLHELTNRINQLEDTNKKLMKSLSTEVQNKKKLEYQVKDRENKIKELNWKLQKASKFLERSEKNTNTYRRKLVTLQTLMRRRHLIDDRKHRFIQMSSDHYVNKFTDSSLSTGLSILKTCGYRGYIKLLRFNFPLPPLKILQQKFPQDSALNYILIRDEKTETLNEKNKVEQDNKSNTVTNDEIECKNNLTLVEENIRNNSKTITGTVQDIFNESSDNENILDISELQNYIVLNNNTFTTLKGNT